jgi:hypothetical protein
MAKKAKGIGTVLYAAAVIAALGFGAATLQAQPRSCMNDGWEYLGACSSQAECDANCNAVHYPDTYGGKCLGGCCTCYI